MRSQQAPTVDHEHIAHAQMLRGYPAFVAPKSIVGRLLEILRPRVGASPFALLDDDPAAVLDAACYPYC